MSETGSHDQNFKNLLLDFALASIRFFGGAEGELPDDAVITPLRQEQLKLRLIEGHRELDSAFLVECPNGDRRAILFLIEEETEPRHFSIHRLVHYMVDAAELNQTNRIVPIVIFLRPGEVPTHLHLGGDGAIFLTSTYVACHLAELNALDHLDDTNVVARILLPCMHAPEDRRIEIVSRAVEGLATLEASVHKQRKYFDFIVAYAGLEPQQRVEFKRVLDHMHWGKPMTGWLAEERAEGRKEGRVEGLAAGKSAGKAEFLLRAMQLRGLKLTAAQEQLVRGCSDDVQLEAWLERTLSGASAEAVFTEGLANRH